MVCRKIATPVTQRSESPYFTTAAGPSRNSPLPIASPRTMTPGPTTANHPSPRGVGAAGRSARVQGSSPDRASMGTAACSVATAAVVVTRVPLGESLHAPLNRLSSERRKSGLPEERHQGLGSESRGSVSLPAGNETLPLDSDPNPTAAFDSPNARGLAYL